MKITFFDEPIRLHLLPLTFTRPASELRVGMMTIAEKWSYYFPESTIGYKTADYLSELFVSNGSGDQIFIAGNCCPTDALAERIMQLKLGEGLIFQNQLIAFKAEQFEEQNQLKLNDANHLTFNQIKRPFDLFQKNASEMELDFERMTKGKVSCNLSTSNQIMGDRIFAEPGAKAECSILNNLTGPIYLAAGSEIMEGSMIRGGFYLGKNSQAKMGTKVYGATTVGPESRIGGEVNNSIILGYSNKGHDGFLGNSVLGEWCNLGADTNNSNLKNNYDEVKLWNYASTSMEKTGLQFCGLIMGDHSKSGINTMFNTGTVVGVSSNIYGADFPPNFIPSFRWGSAKGFQTYEFEKAIATMERVMERRNKQLSEQERKLYALLFNQTES